MKQFFTTAILFCPFVFASAQDLIYQSDESLLKCKLIEVSEKKVRYKSLQNLKGPDRILEPDEVLMVFNESGSYVVYPLESSSAAAAMNPATNAIKRDFDIVVTTDQQVIQALLTEANPNKVLFKNLATNQDQSLEKSKIVLVMHKAKSPELFVTPNDAMPVLKAVKGKVDQFLTDKPQTVTTQKTTVVEKVPEKKEAAPVVQSTPPPQPVANKAPAANTAPAGNKNTAETYGLSAEQFDEFRNKALVKTDEFTTNLQIISDVNTSREKANTTIDLTTKLFVSEDSRVEVSNVFSGVKNKYKIRSYLGRLLTKSSQYSKVELEFADISYASEFKKGTDGNYYAVISFVQTFKGFKDGEIIYSDVTERHATIVLKLYDKDVEGVTKKAWDVFLADIGVVETRKQ